MMACVSALAQTAQPPATTSQATNLVANGVYISPSTLGDFWYSIGIPYVLANGGTGGNPNAITNTSISFVSGSAALGYGKIGLYDGNLERTNLITGEDGGIGFYSTGGDVLFMGSTIYGSLVGLVNATGGNVVTTNDTRTITLTNQGNVFGGTFNATGGNVVTNGQPIMSFGLGGSGVAIDSVNGLGKYYFGAGPDVINGFQMNKYGETKEFVFDLDLFSFNCISSDGRQISGITDGVVFGNGSGLTNIPGSSINGPVASATSATSATTVTGLQSNLLATALQPGSTLNSSNLSGILPMGTLTTDPVLTNGVLYYKNGTTRGITNAPTLNLVNCTNLPKILYPPVFIPLGFPSANGALPVAQGATWFSFTGFQGNSNTKAAFHAYGLENTIITNITLFCQPSSATSTNVFEVYFVQNQTNSAKICGLSNLVQYAFCSTNTTATFTPAGGTNLLGIVVTNTGPAFQTFSLTLSFQYLK